MVDTVRARDEGAAEDKNLGGVKTRVREMEKERGRVAIS